MAIRSLLAVCAALLATLPARAQPTPDAPSPRSVLNRLRAHEPTLAPPQVPVRGEALRRRLVLAGRTGPGVLWIESGSSADLDHFFQDNDFYYLSGVEIPDITLAVQVDGDGEVVDDVLFLPATDPAFERWNGPRLAPGPASAAATGFGRTLPLAARQSYLAEAKPRRIYALGEPSVAVPEGTEVNQVLLRGLLDRMRLVKSDYELACLRNAILITTAAQRNALVEVRAGGFEYEVQGAIEGTFLRLGADRPGFGSICGSGPNTVILHYNGNRRRMEDGDLIVMDVGAKYRYYCADVTRTVPVNGTFTPRQREIYDIVLAAQTKAAAAARPGITMAELDKVARTIISEAGYGKFFIHGLGHWIGLDVHDVGGRVPIVPGTVFTIEPGIYLAEEGLGVRIEDDYLMTTEGAVKLSSDMPTQPDEIEALMARSS